MQFIPLEKEEQLANIKQASEYNIIFKHNTTCPISRSVRSRFEQDAGSLKHVQSVYVVDIHQHRNLSDSIAEEYNVVHESPQLLLIKNGECTYNESLYDISAQAAAEAISQP